MKALTITDAATIVLGLQDEIRRSADARYDHRLHGVLLVAQGMTCPEVAELLGDAPRTIENWVRRFEHHGVAGLVDQERPGRPPRLTSAQLAQIEQVLHDPPSAVGLTGALWDGKTLAAYLQREFGVVLGVRQAQRLFHQLGFRLRKPRPVIAHADPDAQAAYKKTGDLAAR
jgi:transposase